MGYQLGIDFGTTYTAAAVHRDGQVEVQSLGNRAAAVPTVLFLRADETILVGDPANRRGISDPSRVAREFKRRLGDPTPLLLGGTPYSAEALTAKLLRWVVDAVVERQGGPPDKIALSHPANWGPYKKDLLTQAVRLADLPPVVMLTEPQAAAISYASTERVEAGTVVAVYDLGGGTFDAAVLRKTQAGFEHLGTPEGIDRLGGIDFDEAVYTHVLRSTGDAVADLDPSDPSTLSAVARLRSEAVDAKEALSGDSDTSIPVLLPNVQTEVRLTRAEFEAMIRPTLADTIAALRRTLRSADLKPEDLHVVLLVGGSSRIPLVAQLVTAELNRPVAVDIHPKHAIATGAALAAAQAMGMDAEAASVVQAEPVVAVPAGVPAAPGVATTVTEPVPVEDVDDDAPDVVVADDPAPLPRPPAAPTGSGRRNLTALLVGGLAGVLVLVVLAVFLLGGDPPPQDSPTEPSADADQVVFTEASLGPAGGVLEVPEWPSSPGEEENSTRYTDPETGLYIETIWTDEVVGDLHADVHEVSQEIEQEDSSYELIGITDADHPAADEAVTWEFTAADGADHVQYLVLHRDGITYGIGVESPEEHWFEAKGYWQQSVDTFSVGGDAASTAPEIPSGWQVVEIVNGDATVAVPPDFTPRTDEDTGSVDWVSPDEVIFVRVNTLDAPDDPVAALQAESDRFAGDHEGYEEHTLEAYSHPAADSAALWQFEFTKSSRHGRSVMLVVGDFAYTIEVRTSEDRLDEAAELFDQVLGTFDPPD